MLPRARSRHSLALTVFLLAAACGGSPESTDPSDDDDGGGVGEVVGPGGASCAAIEPLAVRGDKPANVSVLFAIGDCEGVPAVAADRLSIVEGGALISDDAHREVLVGRGVVHVVQVLLDVTDGARGSRGDDILGVAGLARELLGLAGADVLVGIRLFDGSGDVLEWQAPLDDVDRLVDRVDALSLHDSPDPGARNLYGALGQAVADLQDFLESLDTASRGGVIPVGHLVVVTRGGDTAGRQQGSVAQSVIRNARTADGSSATRPTVRVVGLGEDLTDVLAGAAPGGAADIATDWGGVVDSVRGRIESTHLMSFCTPNRAGDHWVTVGLTDGAEPAQVVASGRFLYSADGFSGGCHGTYFRTTCEGQACGGFLCGRCDAETEACLGDEVRSCRDRCQDWDACTDGGFVHPLGYDYQCEAAGLMRMCLGECVDLNASRDHCGGCGISCGAAGSSCEDGLCQCPGVSDQLCDGQCVLISSDIRHCGGCGRPCVAGSQRCDQGVCTCITGDVDGDGNCDDVDADDDGDGCLDEQDAAPATHSDDTDGDGVADDCDRCAGDDAAGDTDADGVCDDQDDDDDGDGCLDGGDPAPKVASGDTDEDGVADDCDLCEGTPDPEAVDTDEDGECDSVDGDDDADGCLDDVDAAPLVASADTDEDGVADDCDRCGEGPDDVDDDRDGVPDACDLCEGDDAAGDSDEDGACDDTDDDDDNDGCADAIDDAPLVAGEDGDGDGIGDDCDACFGEDDPECQCEQDVQEPNDAWRAVIDSNTGARHGRQVTEVADLTLMPGDEDWHSFSTASFFQGGATVSLGAHCEPPLQVRQQRVCVQLQFLSWGDLELILPDADGVPDDLGQPVCGSLAEGVEVGRFPGGPGIADVWVAMLVRVYRHPDDGDGVGPAPYTLTVRR